MRRVGVAVALVAASCGTSTVPAQHTARGDVPKLDYARPRSQETAESYVVPTTRPVRQRAARAGTRPAPRSAVEGDVWAALARCESGMRQDAVGESVHFSFFQWKLATWRSVKADGDPDDPRDASYEAQLAAAQRLQARTGWGQWPACSRKLGLR